MNTTFCVVAAFTMLMSVGLSGGILVGYGLGVRVATFGSACR